MTPSNSCDVVYVDETRVRAVAKKLADGSHLLLLADTFKLLGDPTRLKIILALTEEELCVCDLASLLGVTRSAVSHQLRLLRNLRLVRFRRAGKIVYYSIDDEHISELIEAGLTHVRE